MDWITVDALLIAAVISGVVAGHRLEARKLAFFWGAGMLLFLAVSPLVTATISALASLVIAICFSLAIAIGRIGYARAASDQ
mgnify:CR=1 FL=1